MTSCSCHNTVLLVKATDLFSQHAQHRVCSASSWGSSSSGAGHGRGRHAITGPETAPHGRGKCCKGGLLLGFPAEGSSVDEASMDVMHGAVHCGGDAQGVQAMIALGAAHGVAQLVFALLLLLLLHQI